jgi:hypothetical protein
MDTRRPENGTSGAPIGPPRMARQCGWEARWCGMVRKRNQRALRPDTKPVTQPSDQPHPAVAGTRSPHPGPRSYSWPASAGSTKQPEPIEMSLIRDTSLFHARNFHFTAMRCRDSGPGRRPYLLGLVSEREIEAEFACSP